MAQAAASHYRLSLEKILLRARPQVSPISPRNTTTGQRNNKSTWCNYALRSRICSTASTRDMLCINNKFTTNKTVDKCIRKIKYLIDAYQKIDAVLDCRDIVTLGHVQEAGDFPQQHHG